MVLKYSSRLVAIFLGFFLFQNVEADFLDDYFNDKVFGAAPGPCPDRERSCTTDVGTWEFNENFGTQEICLFENVCFLDLGWIGCWWRVTACGPIRDMFESGDIDIWNVICEDLGVSNLNVETTAQSANSLTALFSTESVRTSCSGDLNLNRFTLYYQDGGDTARVSVSGDGTFTTSPNQASNIDFIGTFQSTADGGFAGGPPDVVTFPANECNIQISAGTTVLPDNGGPGDWSSVQLCVNPEDPSFLEQLGCGIDLSFINMEGVTQAIVAGVEAALGSTICQIISEGSIVTDAVDSLNNFIFENANGAPDDVAAIDADPINAEEIHESLTQNLLDRSINFAEDALVEILSVSLNGWLGSPDSSGDRLLINEAIEDLLGNTQGAFEFDLLEDPLNPGESDIFFNDSFIGPLFDTHLKLTKVSLTGLNTITEFALLENNFVEGSTPADRFRYTLGNGFLLTDSTVLFEVLLTLKRGEWVTESDCGNINNFRPTSEEGFAQEGHPTVGLDCTLDEENLLFSVGFDLEDFRLDSDIFAAFDPSMLDETLIGQVFGQDFREDAIAGFQRVGYCVAPAFYAAHFGSLEMQINDVREPVVEVGASSGLAGFLEGSMDIATVLYQSIFDTFGPGISQGPIREAVNSFLLEDVVLTANLTNCPDYVQGSVTGYFSFEEGLVANLLPVLNNVLGNLEGGESETDINDLIQAAMEYTSATYADFPLEPLVDANGIVIGSWVSKEDDQSIFILPGYLNSDTVQQFLEFRNFRIANLHSIYGFNLVALDEDQLEATFDIGEIPGSAENVADPLTFFFDLDVNIDELESQVGAGDSFSILETFEFSLELSEVELNFAIDNIRINRDLVYRLKFGQINEAQCLLSVLDEQIVAAYSLLQASQIAAFVRTDYLNNPPPDTAHPFVHAMVDLQNSLLGDRSDRFNSMVNTILNNGLANFFQGIANVDTEVVPETCDDAEDPFGSLFEVFTGISLPESDSVAECIEPLDGDVSLSPEEAEAVVDTGAFPYFDFTDSALISTIQGEFGTNEDDANRNSILQRIVFSLANSSGTPLQDSFFLEPVVEGGPEEVTFFLPLSSENFLFSLLDINALIYDDSTIIPGLHAEFSDITVRGINRFVESSKFLETKSRFVTGYAIGFSPSDPLIVELKGYIQASDEFIGDDGNGILRENFTITTEILGLSLDFDLLMAINTNLTDVLSLGHFVNVTAGDQDFLIATTALECILAAVFENGISMPNLHFSIDRLAGPTFTSSGEIFSPELNEVLDESLKVMTQFYIEALPSIAHNCVKDSINRELEARWAASQNGACPSTVEVNLPEEDQIFRFGSSAGLARFQNFVSTNLKANDYALWNQIMRTLTRDGNQGELLFSRDEDGDNALGFNELDMTYKGTPYGTLTALMYNLIIDNLDTFSDLRILEPSGSDEFTTSTGFFIEGPLKLDFNFLVDALEIFAGTEELYNDLDLEFEFTNLNIGLEAFARINITEALQTRFSSVSSFEEIPCILAPFEELDFIDFNFSVDNVHIIVRCQDICDFPMFTALENGAALDSNNDVVLTEIFNDAITFLIDYIEGSGVQGLLDAQIATADETCASIYGLIAGLVDDTTDPEFDVAIYMGYGFLGFVVSFGLGTFILFPVHSRRRELKLKDFSARRKLMETDKEYELFRLGLTSLFQHPSVNYVSKILIPLMCIVHIFGLVFAIVFSGAMDVILIFQVFGADTDRITIVPFTIVSTINDMWNSGSYLLAILIGIASCAWPIIKNGLLLAIWFAPATILGRHKRERTLHILDTLAKWSFLDVFIVVMTLAALRTYLRLSEYSRAEFLADEFFNVDVNVSPERGIILLMVIASSSMVVNHIISSYHAKVVRSDQAREDELRGVVTKTPRRAAIKKAIGEHEFAAVDKRGRRRYVTKKSRTCLMALNIVGGLALLIGVALPVVTFDMGGLIGLAIEQIDRPLAQRTYSVFDLARVVNQAPQDTFLESFSVNFFQILLIAVSTIFPFLLMVSNAVTLTRKFSLADLRWALWINYICSFWSCIEVFVVAIVMTLAELEKVTSYIVDFISDDFCSNIQSILETLVGPQDGSCFEIEGFLEPTAFILFGGLVVQLVCTLCVIQLAEAVIADRYFQAYNGIRALTKPAEATAIRRQILRLMTGRKLARANAVKSPSKAGDGEDDDDAVEGFSILDSPPTDDADSRSPRSPPPPSQSVLMQSNPMFDVPASENGQLKDEDF